MNFKNKHIKYLKKQEAEQGREKRHNHKISKFSLFRMFASFKNKPNTQKIIGNYTTSSRKHIAKREKDPMKIRLFWEYLWYGNTEDFKTPNLHYGA